MRIDFPPNKVIEINGREFEVKVSDFEAFTVARELVRDFEGIKDANGTDGAADTVIAVLSRAFAALDRLLGKGAAKKIIAGHSVSINFMLESVVLPVLAAVLETGGKTAERVAEEYE